MLSTFLFNDRIWVALGYLPFGLALLAGVMLAVGVLGSRGWQPTCRACRHDLRGVESGVCPECGADLARSKAVRPGRWAPRWTALVLGFALALVSGATLPPWSFNLEWVRKTLTGRLTPEELFAATTGGKNSRASSEINRRIAAGDETFRLAIVDACLAEFEQDVTGSPSSVQSGVFRQSISKTPLDGDRLARLAGHMLAHVRKGEWTPALAWSLAGSLEHSLQDGLLPFLLADDAMVLAGVTCASRQHVVTGTSVGVACSWRAPGAVALLSDTQLDIESATWRPSDAAPDAPWTPLTQAARPARDNSFVMLQFAAPGKVTVRITGQVVVASSGTQPDRKVPFSHDLRVDVIAPESVPITTVRGGEERAAIEAMLRSFKPTASEDGAIHFDGDLPRPNLRSRTQQRSRVLFQARVQFGQDGGWHDFGAIHLKPGSYGMGGMLPPGAVDPKRPFVIRMTPDAEAARRSGAEEILLLDEVAELHFEKVDEKPTSIVWLDPAAPTVAPP